MNELREYLKRKFNLSDSDYQKLVDNEKQRIKNPSFEYNGIDLDEAKEMKIKELSHHCKQDIVYGFTATNGNPYRLTLEDQMNMQGQKALLDSDTTITSVDWLTMTDVQVTHTRDEWLAVYSEAFNHKDSAIWKNKNLREQVKVATTITEVEAIVW